MQPQQCSRIDVVDLKAQIVKKLGPERSNRYFYFLNKFLSQRLGKIDFEKCCFRLFGRENLPLHNQFIRSILKNASRANIPPPSVQDVGPTKAAIIAKKLSPSTEVGQEQSRAIVPNQKLNGVVLPISPRKGRSTIRDRKLSDRPSPLGPNGKADIALHHSMATEDSRMKTVMENGSLTPCDYQRPMQHSQGVAMKPDNAMPRMKKSSDAPVSQHSKDQVAVPMVEDGEEVEQANDVTISRCPLLAPLGIPFCTASVGGARKALPVASSSSVVSYFDSGGLSDSETLRNRMEQIAIAQGLGGVSMECANTLNHMLDVYLKRLIRSCVELVGARSAHEPKKHPALKQQLQSKPINGMWPSNHSHMNNSGKTADLVPEQRPSCSISLLDFKIAMELNPQQLGEDWPLLLEKICMHSFEE